MRIPSLSLLRIFSMKKSCRFHSHSHLFFSLLIVLECGIIFLVTREREKENNLELLSFSLSKLSFFSRPWIFWRLLSLDFSQSRSRPQREENGCRALGKRKILVVRTHFFCCGYFEKCCTVVFIFTI